MCDYKAIFNTEMCFQYLKAYQRILHDLKAKINDTGYKMPKPWAVV